MYQEDYIKRMIEQLSIFIRKLLKLDINIEEEQYIIEFEKMLLSNFKSHIQDIDKINDDFINKYVVDESSKNNLASIFYKASIIYFNKNKDVSLKCHHRAENIENINATTINPFILNNNNEKLIFYKEKSVKLHEV